MVFKFIMLIAAILIGTAWAQSETENATESVTSIPTPHTEASPQQQLQNHVFQEITIMCEKNGASNSSKNLQENGAQKALRDSLDWTAKSVVAGLNHVTTASNRMTFYDILTNVTKCVHSVINVSSTSEIQQEIEEAKPLGKLDEVFKKYCEKQPGIINCASKLIEPSKNCLSADHYKQFEMSFKIFGALVDFICYKEGDRIALFIAEHGQTCLETKSLQLGQCMNKTIELDHRFKMNNFSDIMEFDRQECDNASKLQKCLFDVLETCPTSTTANIFHSLYKFIRKATPCSEFPDPNISDSATSLYVTSATLVMAAFTILIF